MYDVERARPRIGRKVTNEESGRAGSEQRDEEERAQAEESWRGARGGLWGLLPSSVSGKRVGTDDHLTPSPSNTGCSAPCAASLPGGGLGAAGLSLSFERKHLLSRPTQSAEPGSRASSGDHVGLLLLLLLPVCFSHVRLCMTQRRQPPGSSIPGTLQARTLEWVAISFSSACTHAC